MGEALNRGVVHEVELQGFELCGASGVELLYDASGPVEIAAGEDYAWRFSGYQCLCYCAAYAACGAGYDVCIQFC